MKYSVTRTGPLVYLAMLLLYIAGLKYLFYNPLPLMLNLFVMAGFVFALMEVSRIIDKRPVRQILLINILFSYAIAYCFNGALFGTMDRLSNGSALDRTYRAFSTGLIIPSGMIMLAICGNYADRIRMKSKYQKKNTAKE